MAFETASVGKTPIPALSLDSERLLEYLQQNEEGEFLGIDHLEVLQLTYGQSNPTYILKGSEGQSWVLRKKPTGHLLPSAHQIEREVTILKALEPTPVPIPRVMHYCQDSNVVGTAFYVMEHVKGVVFTDPNLPALAPEERAAVYQSIAETLAKLHEVDPVAIGLEGFGRPGGYCERQVRRWWQQAVAAVGVPSNAMEQLKTWLQANIPDSDSTPQRPTITHGDFSFANLIFSKESNDWNVKAIVDWELSTLGDGWADVAYSCLPFYGPSADALPKTVTEMTPGIPSEDAFVQLYASRRNISVPPGPQWAFYKALALFRIASICQGVGARAAQGNASSELAKVLGSEGNVALLVNRALEIISRAESLHAKPAVSVLPLLEFDVAGFSIGDSTRWLIERLKAFMDRHVFPLESEMAAHVRSEKRWTVFPRMEELKAAAQQQGLWNLFAPPDMAAEIEAIDGLTPEEKSLLSGPRLSNLEYCFLAEIMGRCLWASEVFNCSAPDTGNMEILSKFGTMDQKRKWLVPLLKGEIRSCFAMTEKLVASSDATNIQSRIQKRWDGFRLSGKKWWTSGAMHPACKICIFMGKTDTSQPVYKQQSMILTPMDSPGIEVKRGMSQFGYDDAPVGHPEMHFSDVVVPLENLLGNEGQGFEIAQSRLGPGRLHHCMRLIGVGKVAMDLAKKRVHHRVAFGSALAQRSSVQMDIGQCAIQWRAARLLVLSAAEALDRHGGKAARVQIAAAKVFVPKTVAEIVDRAMQLHGGAGLSDDFPLAQMYAAARALRIADGPDEVHVSTIGKLELTTSKL